MKTVRTNTFETNSSSTHSISIRSIKENEKTYEPLVENGTLYPTRISQYAEYIDHREGGYNLVCRTKEQKAALAACWVNSVEEIKDCPNEKELIMEQVLKVAKSFGFENVDFQDKYTDYRGYSEYGDSAMQYAYWHGEDPTQEFINDVDKLIERILPDDIEMVDSDIPW